MKNIKQSEEINYLELNTIDSFNTEIESFYRLNSELAHKYTQSQQTIDLIKKLATQKKKFFEYYNENISSETGVIISFFTKILYYSEIKKQKDLMDYSLEEVKEAITTIAFEEKIDSKSIYGAWLSIIHHYFRWGYQQAPKLKSYIICSLDLPGYREVLDFNSLGQKVLTWKQMLMLVQKIDSIMADCILLLVLVGLKLDEIINIKRVDVENSVGGKLDLVDRSVVIPPNIYEKILSVSKLDTMPRLLSNGDVKELKLNDSPYLIRSYYRKDFGSDRPQTVSMISKMVSTELGRAGYNGSIKDFRACGIVNDIYNWYRDIKIDKNEVYLYVNKKYGLNMTNSANINIRYREQLEILTEMYRKEGKL